MINKLSSPTGVRIYSKYFLSYTGNGRYSLIVCVEGKDGSQLVAPTTRPLYIPGGYVEKVGIRAITGTHPPHRRRAAGRRSTKAMQITFSLIIFLHLFSMLQSSFIQLNNGSYEHIVIAINPGLQENDLLIEKIKQMVKEASAYLFQATENRLSIKNVKILIPLTWTLKNSYEASTKESYEKADIIISSPIWKFGDSLYTNQYRGCGEQGEYIHLTPDYLLNANLSSVYGSPGRTFVHEWAHLRWGVFDEYSTDIPYYISGELKVEATRCSANLKGSNIMQECDEDGCSVRNCKVDAETGLYEQGCLFLPEKVQNVQESIMYSAAIPSIISFCNDSNHVIEAPSLQNRMCNCRSTWDVIMNSTDIISTPPRSDTDLPVPTFTLMQSRRRVITLAFDISGSMGPSGRFSRLLQGAEFFLTQIVETGTYVGIVEFYTFAFTNSELIQINDEKDRAKLISLLPPKVANYGADICKGILESLKVNKKLDGSTAGTEILLASDGDIDLAACTGDILASGAVFHIIALGSETSKKLEDIALMTGGQKHFVKDASKTHDIFYAFSALSSQNGNVTQQSIMLESRSSTLEPEGCLNGTVFIDSTVGTSTFFLVTWQVAVPNIRLKDPKGTSYHDAQFTNSRISNSSELQILLKAETGAWNYTLCNNRETNQVVGMTATSRAAAENVPPITVKVHMNKDTNDYPDPLIIYASVHQGLLTLINLQVTAIVEAESGNPMALELLDNGAGADVFKNDGVYSRFFTSFSQNGRYNLKVHVESKETEATLVLPRNHALYIPGYTENGGESMNPSRSAVTEDDLHITVGHIGRTASGGFFLVNKMPTSPRPIIHKPCKIIDLEASAQGNSVILSWTASGEDMDQGRASRYDLRVSTKLRDLRDNFKNSSVVDISSIAPQLFGSREKFTFEPGIMIEENETVLYFALTAINKDNQESDISNIAHTKVLTNITPESSTVLFGTTRPGTSVPPPQTITTENSARTPTSDKLRSTETITTDIYSTIQTTEEDPSSSIHSSRVIPTDYTNPTVSSTDTPDADTPDNTVPNYTGSFQTLISISSPPNDNLTLTETNLPPIGSLITPTTGIYQPTHSTESDVKTLISIYSTIIPTDDTLSVFSNSVPSKSVIPSSDDTLPPTTSDSISPTTSLMPTDNSDTTISSTLSTLIGTVPPTLFTEPPNEYTSTTTDTSLTPMDFTFGSTIPQISDTVTVTSRLISNNTSSIPTSVTKMSSSASNINVTVVVVVVCVAAILICIIICVTIYCVKKSTSGSFTSILA
ncbi:calcium-activated chloride channel regulator 1-like [Dendrobates tinctorius]|uniref:calcium-activated chloride channel regulator 1-like n=1 Tax=Dendrobates tinctorius TaxID=92724 RepID=UPI003CC93701